MQAMVSRPRVLSAVLLIALLIPGAGFAEEPAGRVLDWETGAGKSYVIPALELLGFVVALNQFNRHFIDSDEYGSDGHTIWKNLRTAPDFDKDGTGSGGGVSSDNIGRELISRGTVGLAVRLYGPHALGLQYTVSSRESSSPGVPDRHQSIQTVSLAYNFLGHRRFGAVEWRGPE
jgi:hypothetical protein